jgi:hypothetical protein
MAPLPSRPRQDSNLRNRLRRPVLYPLSYGGERTNATGDGCCFEWGPTGLIADPRDVRSAVRDIVARRGHVRSHVERTRCPQRSVAWNRQP